MTHLSIWGSMASWFFFMIIYSYCWQTILIAPEMSGMAPNVLRGSTFYFGLIFVPIFVLLPDFVYKS
jgi:phospholipid-transporting ATPase